MNDIDKKRLIPILVVNNAEEADMLLRALISDGIFTAEITFRTPFAAAAIDFAVKNFPQMTIGAGTVISYEQCSEAITAGAKFIVSPGLSAEVCRLCKDRGLPYYPGCVTPNEIMQALSMGLTTVKFFPCNIYGGITAIKALSAPFKQIKFIPTGGINYNNLDEYLDFEQVFAVGGSFIAEEAIKKCR